MATYAIGDIQGCYRPLQDLLARCAFDPASDRLWLVGDLVNRGPDSLAVLRLLRSLGDAVHTVLGNHDLYLLMLAAGVRPRGADEGLSTILQAPDRDELLHWLRQQPLLRVYPQHVLVHAGLLPQWSWQQAAALAAEVATVLRAGEITDFLLQLAGNKPRLWDDSLAGMERLRLVVNACTRMRFCHADGSLDFDAKGPPNAAPKGCLPWFELPSVRPPTHTIVCGHWSALGLHRAPGLLALDTGCVWGGPLTAVRIENDEVIQVPGQT